MARGIRAITRGGRKAARREVEGPAALRALVERLPDDLRRRALTHSSWVEHRADSYGRLAFLGDAVLGLAIAQHLFVRSPRADIGRLTKVHGQAVSGRACAEVAADLGLPEMMAAIQPESADSGIELDELLGSERALASVCEAVIGACYLHHGFDRAATAIVAAFAQQVELATETLLDFKSALQERVARDGRRVRYEVTSEAGPPHDRSFEVEVTLDGEGVGSGAGRSKKAAEQAAAAAALEWLEG